MKTVNRTNFRSKGILAGCPREMPPNDDRAVENVVSATNCKNPDTTIIDSNPGGEAYALTRRAIIIRVRRMSRLLRATTNHARCYLISSHLRNNLQITLAAPWANVVAREKTLGINHARTWLSFESRRSDVSDIVMKSTDRITFIRANAVNTRR